MVEMSLENAKFIDQIVASGRFKSRQEVIDEAVRILRSEMQQNMARTPPIR